jgi:hypothetical protein
MLDTPLRVNCDTEVLLELLTTDSRLSDLRGFWPPGRGAQLPEHWGTQMNSDRRNTDAEGLVGTRDGLGAGDHDQPYRFGYRPSATTTYPFSTRQYVRLLVLRGRVQDGDIDEGDLRWAA